MRTCLIVFDGLIANVNSDDDEVNSTFKNLGARFFISSNSCVLCVESKCILSCWGCLLSLGVTDALSQRLYQETLCGLFRVLIYLRMGGILPVRALVRAMLVMPVHNFGSLLY